MSHNYAVNIIFIFYEFIINIDEIKIFRCDLAYITLL